MHTLVIGHRGASGYRPEHTRAAYDLAFGLGADAVEPDVVATRDGVLVVRHENEISGTTDVEARPEFAHRRTEKLIAGAHLTGWFTEDFTWAELATLRARERMPKTRRSNASFDGEQPILRLRDVFALVDAAAESTPRPLAVVAEIKHATYFASIGLPLDELFAAEVEAAGWNDGRLVTESFEVGVLSQLAARGIRGNRIFLLENEGQPHDEIARHGTEGAHYAHYLTPGGLAGLGEAVQGVSVHKSRILKTDAAGNVSGATTLVDEVHAAGLTAFCWTLRPENRFLAQSSRRGGRASHWGNWQQEFRTILGSGIDGVFADHPDLAVHVRDAPKPGPE
ncbi:glycerophosphodiester phosphodiesterase family protein [Cryobacterium psychrophilum]|uniref:glycerophosphodiester phosphodiesterase n=1 Tax=Cryobacterium psychrophilum TaxID=41988 RepID=A0A4Y8KXJ7_9MICO|nr:glycerophosphodiester phosphodiesterase family protein [Cryobacterium psychrophilum]TDW29610.1 glycerophosphoryl diester phosphodiesterase [Cryobacterium psychrophilum]TFD81736.1 glycerophosphodiester phosphodiesterase [Cryobacterium psychrophilum]